MGVPLGTQDSVILDTLDKKVDTSMKKRQPRRRYADMTERELQNLLTKRNTPAPQQRAIMERIDNQRGGKKSANATRRTHNELWGAVLNPLRYERNNVKSGLNYAASQERRLAMEGYLVVLNEITARLEHDAKQYTHTPGQLARERNKARRGSPIPNAGIHWTDWVPTHIKLRVSNLFDAIPYTPRAKRKLAFERKVPKDMAQVQRIRLALRIDGDMHKVVRLMLVAPTPENKELLSRIRQAKQVMADMAPDSVFPHTWHALVPPSTGVEDET